MARFSGQMKVHFVIEIDCGVIFTQNVLKSGMSDLTLGHFSLYLLVSAIS